METKKVLNGDCQWIHKLSFLEAKILKNKFFLLLSNNRKLSVACIVFWISRLGIKQRMCWKKLYWNQNRINDLCVDLVCCLVALMHWFSRVAWYVPLIKHNFHLTISFSFFFVHKGIIIRSLSCFCFMQYKYVHHARNSEVLYKNRFWSSLENSNYFFLTLRNKETNLVGVA